MLDKRTVGKKANLFMKKSWSQVQLEYDIGLEKVESYLKHDLGISFSVTLKDPRKSHQHLTHFFNRAGNIVASFEHQDSIITYLSKSKRRVDGQTKRKIR